MRMRAAFLLLLIAAATRTCFSQVNTPTPAKPSAVIADGKNDTLCTGVSDKVCQIMKQMDKTDVDQLEKFDAKSIMVRLVKSLEAAKKEVQTNADSIKMLSVCQTLQWRSGSSENFFSFSNKIFYYSLNNMTWTDARSWCDWRGMQMPMLKTATDLEKMSAELKDRVQTDAWFWLAASNGGGKGAGKVFSWSDNAKVEGSAWASGQPNDMGPGKDICVEFSAQQGKLGDRKCAQSLPILCEVPEGLHPCFYTN